MSELYVRSRQAGIVVALIFGTVLFAWWLLESNRIASMAMRGIAVHGKVSQQRIERKGDSTSYFLVVSLGSQKPQFTVSAETYAASPKGSPINVYLDPTHPENLSLNHVTLKEANTLRLILVTLWICGGALVLLAFSVASNEANDQLHKLAKWELAYLAISSVRSGGTESSIVRATGSYVDVSGETHKVVDLRMQIQFKLDAPLPILYDPGTFVACTLDSIRYAELA